MDFFDVIQKRYTHKETFTNQPIPREHLEKIAHAGLTAPSGCNAQSVVLVIVDDAEVLAALCAVASSAGLRSAQAAIVVLTDPSTQAPGMNYEIEDYSAAAENMLLAATALEYGSVWLDHIVIDRAVQLEYLRILGAPESFNVRTVLPIGKPDGEGSRREKKPFQQRVSFNRYT